MGKKWVYLFGEIEEAKDYISDCSNRSCHECIHDDYCDMLQDEFDIRGTDRANADPEFTIKLYNIGMLKRKLDKI